MFECWNVRMGVLEGLGGLESLEFRGKRCPFSNSNSHLELTGVLPHQSREARQVPNFLL
jgi:hypothetical protein